MLLAACGAEETPPPTSLPDTQPAATIPGGATVDGNDAIAAGSPGVGSPVGTAALTLGALADRVDAAWAGVRSFRAVFVSGPAGGDVAASPVASPNAGSGTVEITREAILPDRQRQVTHADGVVESEAIAVAGRVYVRGTLARLLRPEVTAETWVEVDPAALDPSTELGLAVASLAAPITPPTATIPPNLRPQELRPLGTVTVGDRTCEVYGAAATTQTGGRIDLTIAVGPDDLPCFVETLSGGVVGRITYEALNLPLTIEPPAGALPAASPVAPATPGGRD